MDGMKIKNKLGSMVAGPLTLNPNIEDAGKLAWATSDTLLSHISCAL